MPKCCNYTTLASSTHFGSAAPENKTLMQPSGMQGMSTNATNIVLVHGGWADGSSWSKVISILQKAGHKVIAVQLPTHSLADDVATVKRAIDLVGKPVTLVGHSYGGEVITNAAYNNPNVTGLVYIAAFAPNEGQSLSTFVSPAKFPNELFIKDSGGFSEKILPKMLIPLKQISWQLSRSLLTNHSSSRNPALRHGSIYQHGIKSQMMIT